MRFASTILVVNLFFLGVDSVAGPLENLVEQMEREVSQTQSASRTLTENYVKRLESLALSYQEAGKLNELLATKKEIEKPGKAEHAETFAELANLRKIYLEALPGAEEADRQASSRVLAAYQVKLDALTSEWTKAGDIENATKAMEQSKRVAAAILDLSRLSSLTKKSFPNREGARPGDESVCGLGMTFVWIPPGSFQMGSPLDEPHRKPKREGPRKLNVDDGFWIAQCEVTQGQFAEIMGEHKFTFKGDPAALPAEEVSWDQAVEFCEKLTDRERTAGRLSSDWSYAIPTEHQWEYACRAGDSAATPGGTMDEVAWTAENSDQKTQHVGTKKPNAWGVHDMLGNVWEWTRSAFSDDPTAPMKTAPPGAETKWVIRGGSVKGGVAQTRAAHRDSRPNSFHWHDLGFRPVIVRGD